MKQVIPALLATLFVIITIPKQVSAEIGCNDRYLTLVNPIRGRNLWFEKSLAPLKNQYSEIKKNNFSATWLLQYDVLIDIELVNEIERFDEKQELGIFLEVSPLFSRKARVVYPHAVAWDDPNAVFLSGYTQSERIRLINTVFDEFRNKFGYFPKSVGAWWIDSYSLNYMVNKYKINSVLIVADQKTTDDYGVWGQWWGVPYYLSKSNILVPTKSVVDSTPVVIQWAQRDFDSAYGEGPEYSNYSLQANDYTERGFSTSYFVDLVEKYLDCGLSMGQVTVGLETGMESVKSFPEYKKQLAALSQFENLKSVTMSQFADEYREVNKQNPDEIVLGSDKSKWILTKDFRKNDVLGDNVSYNDKISFSDYFLADTEKFLDRRLPIKKDKVGNTPSYLFPFIGFALFLILFWSKRDKGRMFFSIFLSFLSYYLFFKSYSKFGWEVYYSFSLFNLAAGQFLLAFISSVILYKVLSFLEKIFTERHLFYSSIVLTFFLEVTIKYLRYTYISGIKYFGFLLDAFRFIGITDDLKLVNKDFPGVVASSMLKFDFARIWDSQANSLFLLPLFHLGLGMIVYSIFLKLKVKSRKYIYIGAFLVIVLFLITFGLFDPRFVR